MLNERQIDFIVRAAMSRYAAENDGRTGLARNDVASAVAECGGNHTDVRMAMAIDKTHSTGSQDNVQLR